MIEISPIDPPVADFPPISALHRMELGAIAPWGNPSYLATCMGVAAPATPWHEGMSSSKFQCPVCAAGVVTAKSHPTMRGVISMACDRGCGSAALREACEACAPRAFRYDADLIPPMPDNIVRALTACANDGTFAAGMAVPMRVITKMRQGAALVTITQVKAPNGATHILTLRTDYHAGMPETKTFRQFHLVYPIDGAPTVEVGLPEAPWPPIGSDVLYSKPGVRVIVTEGEKAMAGAAALLPDMAVITSLNGAGNAHNTDWSELSGRDMTIIPDNDQASREYAESVAAQVLSVGAASVSIMSWPVGTPDKHDLGDPLPAGATVDDLRRWIGEAVEVRWADVKHALRVPREAQQWPPFRLPDGHLARRKHVVEAIEQALGHITSGCHRRPWLRTLGCIYHALGADGMGLAVAWSKRGSELHGKFREGEVERVFEALTVNPEPGPMQVVDLFWEAWRQSKAGAKDAEGWRPDAAAEAEAALAKYESRIRKGRQGDNIVIASQERGSDGSYSIELLREAVAESYFKSELVPTFDGKKQKTIFELWERNQRIRPKKVVFRPGEEVAADELNLFQGLTVHPRQNAGSYALYRALLDRISRENGLPPSYLWNLLAYRMQHLDRHVPVAVVIIGDRGSFKSTLTKVIHRLLAPYSTSISDPENLVGQNNGSLQDKLFVQAEEMELRSAAQNNRLQNYITNTDMDYHDKYKRKWDGQNRTFIMMTSNERVPIRVAPDERRYLVLRLNDPFQGDEAQRGALWERMHAELDSGGYEALLYDLQATDLSGFNLRVIPRTLLFEELAGVHVDREPMVAWWREILEDGFVRMGDGSIPAWTAQLPKEALYQTYWGWSQRNGAATHTAVLRKDQWGKRLKELVGGDLRSERVSRGGDRTWVLALPEYETCCAAFEKQFRTTIDRQLNPPVLAVAM